MMAEMLQLQFRLEPEDGQLTNDQPLSISQAINQFVDHLKESKQALQGQQELLRFQARIGRDKPMSTLHAIEVGEYAKWTTENVEDPSTRLDPVKKFLTFANRRGWTENSLARYAAAPRRNRRRFQNTGQNGTYTGTPSARLSQERHTELQVELQRLRDEVPQIREAIRLARSDGDVRENAPLDAAKDHQGIIESRIRVLETSIANAQIRSDTGSAAVTRSTVGARVTLKDVGSGRVVSYTLVDIREADAATGKISTQSPVGHALLDRTVGEEVTINVPRGTLQYLVQKIVGS
jgi:transcription elongation factor GreA